MAKKQFQAESKKLLDMMIHSVYTNKEIFLREIISNASDATDKRYFNLSQAGQTGLDRSDYTIRVALDQEARTITITDKGIGMTQEDLENNLGVIAQSGSLNFKTENAEQDGTEALDIIGQFGVGFYSAFMVADKIIVNTKAEGSTQAYTWESTGVEGYEIKETQKEEVGTEIIFTLKEDTEDEKYSDFLTEWKIKELIKRYSDYIRYPIVMNVEKRNLIESTEEERNADNYEPQYDVYYEDETINSMVPIWKRSPSEVTKEEYNQFYQDKFYEYTDPAKVISTNVEGLISYNALLFIPAQVPFNFYGKDYKRGLQLYSSGVMIMDKCEDLIPEYFGFVKGLVDSQDLSLNISRELLQQNRQLKAIATRLEKKIASELQDLMKKDRDAYEEFFNNFGLRLKFGVYDNYGMNKEKLQDLLIFKSSTEEKQTTLKEYVERMKENQKFIYYATGESAEKIKKMPQMELLMDQGYEVLYFTDEIDEFAIKVLMNYEDVEFKSIADDDLGIEQSEEEKKEAEAKNEESKDLLESIKEALGDKVTAVKLSTRLKTHPVCFATGEGLSLEMEKVLKEQAKALGQAPDMMMKAQKVLEINGEHPMFAGLKNAKGEKLEKYANLLYDQAMLIEGMSIEDPVAFSNLICELMV